MAATKQLISTVTLGSSTAEIDFTSIPQNFTDLVLVVSLRLAVNDSNAGIKINGTETGLFSRRLEGNGATTASATGAYSLLNAVSSTATSNTFANNAVYFANYTSAAYKSFSTDSVGENNTTTAFQRLSATLWSNTDAITSITIMSGSGDLAGGSSASLYGITSGNGGATVS